MSLTDLSTSADCCVLKKDRDVVRYRNAWHELAFSPVVKLRHGHSQLLFLLNHPNIVHIYDVGRIEALRITTVFVAFGCYNLLSILLTMVPVQEGLHI